MKLKTKLKVLWETLKHNPTRLFTGKPKTFKSINEQNEKSEFVAG